METDTFKARLEEEKHTREARMRSVGRPNPAVPGDWEAAPTDAETEPDPVDQAELVTERANDAAILNDLEARYDRVLAALARIEQGTYGICEVGGQTIEEDRLRADPAATTCKAHLNA